MHVHKRAERSAGPAEPRNTVPSDAADASTGIPQAPIQTATPGPQPGEPTGPAAAPTPQAELPGQTDVPLPTAAAVDLAPVAARTAAPVAGTGARQVSARADAVQAPPAVPDAGRGRSEKPDVPTARPEQASRPTTAEEVERADQVLRQIRLHFGRDGVRQATLSLAPAELGRLSIRIKVRDGKVTAVVRAESPETLDVLERHLPELRSALAQSGLEPGSFDLGLEREGDRTPDDHPTPARAFDPSATDPRRGRAPAVPPATLLAALRGGVDTYA